ncbi:Hypothetical protein FKW44_015338 [Caligus rogercresseyi]|uniref:Uncharacterized protein n=1 Tax=Caligus rogercresseyi TaxID=217165 RepID=A0A7T8H065_CALRO|nr:Hypothetical protein FKW44_015338 [Caligus rogercresseyi]
MAFEGFLTRIFTIGEGFETPIPHFVAAGGTQGPKGHKMAFEGFLLLFLQFAMGLKPQYTIVVAGGTRGPKVHKMALRGSLLVFFTIGEGFENPIPHCCGWRNPKVQGAQNGI